MKNLLINILLLCSLSALAITFSPDAKRNCQQMDSVNGTVTLIFCTDQAHFGVTRDSLMGIWVSGSINDLGDTTLGYRLDQWSEDSCLYHTFTCAELEKPGNSGQPEFVFYYMKTDSTCGNIYPHRQRSAQIDPRLVFHNGIDYTLILLPCGADYFTTDLDELAARDAEAREIRPLSDFNLSDSVDQHRISNFRLTPGTKHLYRSYHPYYPSAPQYDTEERRLYWCAELGRRAGIRSDISLTGNYESRVGRSYVCGGDSFVVTIPNYQQALINKGDILYVGNRVGRNPTVVECYYHSEDTILAQYIREIVQFIADTVHPMPVQIHCAIGTDRTGLVCAVIAALCGADWPTIAHDYMESGNMKIQTYRHPNRLIYALEKMTGMRPDKCSNAELAAAIRYHLVDRMQVLTNAEINAMVSRLTEDIPVTFTDEAKRNCQQMDSTNGTVTLIFCTDKAHFDVSPEKIKSVWVSGSITNMESKMPGYQLEKWSNDSCFYHTFTCDELEKPGDSGQPEFVFWVEYTNGSGGNFYFSHLREVQMDRYLVYSKRHSMIMLPCGADYFTTDTAVLGARCEDALYVRPLSGFDLRTETDQQTISNFRRVPGTTNLYRSYHPYYPNSPTRDTEERRVYWAGELGRLAGVRSDICLTSNLESKAGTWYVCGGDSFQVTIPQYQQDLIARGNILYPNQGLSVANSYYQSDGPNLSNVFKEIVQFVDDTIHPMPMQIHCSLGADRTGIVCAMIAVLCGADWEDVAEDYYATSYMWTKIYRHPNRLIYALEKMTGLRPDRCSNTQLAAAIRYHLVDRMQVLTNSEIDAMVTRLTGGVYSKIASVNQSVDTPSAVYDLLGRRVGVTTPGVQLRIDAQGRCTKRVVRP